MSDTIPNIIILPATVTNIYTNASVVAAGILIGDQIKVSVIGQGFAKLYAGAVAPADIDEASGYERIDSGETATNESGDDGAFIYSRLGCVINVGAL